MYRQDAPRFNSVVNDGWEMFFEAVEANVKANSILKWIKVRNCSYKPDITRDGARACCWLGWGKERRVGLILLFLMAKSWALRPHRFDLGPWGETFRGREGSFLTQARGRLTCPSVPLGAAWERKGPLKEPQGLGEIRSLFIRCESAK